MKLYSALYNSEDPFGLFDECVVVYTPDEILGKGVLLLHGGEDISPSIYKEQANSFTHAGDTHSQRDRAEIKLVKRAIKLGLPIIGICRGAQLLCALSGGSIIQHVTGHHRSHPIFTEEGKTLITNSIHHQMMLIPEKVPHKLIAWSEGLSDAYIGEHDLEHEGIKYEPEIVYFPKTNAFCIQGHPEMLSQSNPFVQYCKEKISEVYNVVS